MRLVAEDPDGSWLAVLPLVHVRSRIFGNYLVSMPFLNDGGPVGGDAGCRALVDAAVQRAGELGVDLLEVRSREAVEGLTPITRKVTVLLDLPDSPETLWEKGFRSKLRSQIRRAQREDMEVRIGPAEEDGFYDVFRRNMRDLGTPVLPRRFFREMARQLPGRIVFATVRLDGKPVAAGCGFVFSDEFEMTWASSLREYNALAPNMLLYASLMEEMIRRDVRAFNFGRCTPGAGTHRFKLQWGGGDEPLFWTEWPATDGSRAEDEPGPLLQLASRAWQRLPLPVADRVGPWLAARIPRF